MGVPAKVVQELLGHSTISITMDVYSHVLPAMHKDAMDKMDAFLVSSQFLGERKVSHVVKSVWF